MKTAPPPAASTKSRASPLRSAVEWVLILGGALLVALVIKTFLLQAFYIPSTSMEPTLGIGDRVLVNKLSYDLHPVHRGDVVVFKRPSGETDPLVRDLIKRVVGVAGDTVESRDGAVWVNDRRIQEPYVRSGSPTTALTRQVVPPGRIFVMGDNRTNSKDSRVFGPIPESLVVGRAFIRIWPLGGIRLM